MSQTKFRIGICHYIANFTDGVGLEMNKWRQVLEEMGHRVRYCAGKYGAVEEYVIEEMYHHLPEIERLNHNTFKELRDYDATGYKLELDHWVAILEEKFRQFILEEQINFILAENVWGVAANPAVAIALEQVRREFNLPALAHSHDFYWERIDGVALTNKHAIELADKVLPPRDPKIKHAVINSLAQRELQARKGITATIVPNVFDFEAPAWKIDDYNHDFRVRIGVSESDLLILQATRIVSRKGIELAIDFVKALDAPDRRALLQARGIYDGRTFTEEDQIVFVLAGYARDDVGGNYKQKLAQKAEQNGVKALFIEDFIEERRGLRHGKKVYSLWDSYVHADFVTYPSLWEGWGNQFLEAVRAKLPILMFEYPVYEADIKNKGFRVVSLGNTICGYDREGLAKVPPEVIDCAADQAVALLSDRKRRQEIVEHNFRIAKKYFSMGALREYLEQILSRFDH
jgi:glycosyltransferase involved in cell wall biosynthesis